MASFAIPQPRGPVDTLRLSEFFVSIQGESTYVGRPCVFVRTAGCHLVCHYCDTRYAASFSIGDEVSVADIVSRVQQAGVPLVLLTGGEPLLQCGSFTLMKALLDLGFTVLLETSGSCSIANVDERVVCIVDFKAPGSRESEHNHYDNIDHLLPHDEVKIVLSDHIDYTWAKDLLYYFELDKRCTVLLSPVFGQLNPKDLAEWIMSDRLPVRMQVQLHKVIWPEESRGV